MVSRRFRGIADRSEGDVELTEAYEWEKWVFWALLVSMLVLAVGAIVVRIRRSDRD